MPTIHKKVEAVRGCGYRKKGGIYLVSGSLSGECGKLPIPLTVCPCCGAGVKFTRGFTWITTALFSAAHCEPPRNCYGCPFFTGSNIENDGRNLKKMGLLWVGEKYYLTAEHFNREATAMGVSKRIAQVPRDFELGVTWIALAHIKAVSVIRPEGATFAPGIFRAFKPDAIEYIITRKETDEELEALEKRGFTLIDVIRDIDTQGEIFKS